MFFIKDCTGTPHLLTSSFSNCLKLSWKKIALPPNLILRIITVSHGHMIAIWVLFNQYALTTVVLSHSHVIIICTLHSLLSTSTINGECRCENASHGHLITSMICLTTKTEVSVNHAMFCFANKLRITFLHHRSDV